jgi:hypothetical protein
MVQQLIVILPVNKYTVPMELNPLLDPVLSCFNPVHICTFCLSEIVYRGSANRYSILFSHLVVGNQHAVIHPDIYIIGHYTAALIISVQFISVSCCMFVLVIS